MSFSVLTLLRGVASGAVDGPGVGSRAAMADTGEDRVEVEGPAAHRTGGAACNGVGIRSADAAGSPPCCA